MASNKVPTGDVTQFTEQAEGIAKKYFTDSDPSNDIEGIHQIQALVSQQFVASGVPSKQFVEAYYQLQRHYQVLPPLTQAYSYQLSLGRITQTGVLSVGDTKASSGENSDLIVNLASTHPPVAIQEQTFGPFSSKDSVSIKLTFNSVNWTQSSDLTSIHGDPATFIGASRVVIVPESFSGSIPKVGQMFDEKELQAWAQLNNINSSSLPKYFQIIFPIANGNSLLTSQIIELAPQQKYKIVAQAGERNDPKNPQDKYDNFVVFAEVTGSLIQVDMTDPNFKVAPSKEEQKYQQDNPPPEVIAQTAGTFFSNNSSSESLVILAIDGSGSMSGWSDYLKNESDKICQSLGNLAQGKTKFGVQIVFYADGKTIELMPPTYVHPSDPSELKGLADKIKGVFQNGKISFGGQYETFWTTANHELEPQVKKPHQSVLVIALTDDEFHSLENIDIGSDRSFEAVLEKIAFSRVEVTHIDSKENQILQSFEAFKQQYIQTCLRSALYHSSAVYEQLPLEYRDAFLKSQGVEKVEDFELKSYGDQGVMLLPKDIVVLNTLDSFERDLFGKKDYLNSLTQILNLLTKKEDVIWLANICASFNFDHCAEEILDYVHRRFVPTGFHDSYGRSVDGDKSYLTLLDDFAVNAAKQRNINEFWSLIKLLRSEESGFLAIFQSFAVFAQQGDIENAKKLVGYMSSDYQAWANPILSNMSSAQSLQSNTHDYQIRSIPVSEVKARANKIDYLLMRMFVDFSIDSKKSSKDPNHQIITKLFPNAVLDEITGFLLDPMMTRADVLQFNTSIYKRYGSMPPQIYELEKRLYSQILNSMTNLLVVSPPLGDNALLPITKQAYAFATTEEQVSELKALLAHYHREDLLKQCQ